MHFRSPSSLSRLKEWFQSFTIAASRRPGNRLQPVLGLEILEHRTMLSVSGFDVSSATVDWKAARNAGESFAIIKASDGTSISRAAYLANNVPLATNNGLVVGLYHFGNPNSDPTVAADPSNLSKILAEANREADNYEAIARDSC